MYFVSFYMNCSERSCRTQVLAGAASSTSLFVYCWNHQGLRIGRILSDHSDGSHRAMTGTIAAFYAVSVDNAIVKIHDSVSDLDG